MGLLARLFGTRPSDDEVASAVTAVVASLPGVRGLAGGVEGGRLTYNRQPYGGGALTGTLEVDDAATFAPVLLAAVGALREQVGDDVDRVVLYLTGTLPDGTPVGPTDVGLSQSPSGREVADVLGR